MERRKGNERKPASSIIDSNAHQKMHISKSELDEFFESCNERMKTLAIARKPYKARNNKELTIHSGEYFEVMDDVGVWWCLRDPQGRTGHVPKGNLEIINNPFVDGDYDQEPPAEPIVVKVPIVVKASVHHDEVTEKVKHTTAKPPVEKQPEVIPTPLPKEPETVTPKTHEPMRLPSQAPVHSQPPFYDRPVYHTFVREVIREPSSSRRHGRSKSTYKSRKLPSSYYSEEAASSCSSNASRSSSGVASYVFTGGDYEKRAPRPPSGSHGHRSKPEPKQSCRRPPTKSTKRAPSPRPPSSEYGRSAGGKSPQCCRRSVCCYTGAHSKTRTSMSEKPHQSTSKSRHSQPTKQPEQAQQPQQPMIILLESPTQNSQNPGYGMEAEQQLDNYYDPNNQPEVSIVLPANAQFTPQLTTALGPQQYQYAPQPAFYNWPTYYHA